MATLPNGVHLLRRRRKDPPMAPIEEKTDQQKLDEARGRAHGWKVLALLLAAAIALYVIGTLNR